MEQLLISLPVLIFSVVVHEVAHAWVARTQGDNTAAMLGRITLNPLPHIDPLGSILVPGVMALMGGPILGWARPVPVNARNFRNYKRGDILVSLAGVASNFLLAILFTGLLAVFIAAAGGRLEPGFGDSWGVAQLMCVVGVQINFLLMLFNLIPVPPLDGSHVFYYLLPLKLALRYRNLGQYGTLVLLAVLYLGGFTFIAVPVDLLTGAAIGAARAMVGA